MKYFYIMTMLVLASCGGKLNERYLSSSKPHTYDFNIETETYEPDTIYCYKSLADIECFKTPQRGRERQLVNYIEKVPKSRALNEREDLYW